MSPGEITSEPFCLFKYESEDSQDDRLIPMAEGERFNARCSAISRLDAFTSSVRVVKFGNSTTTRNNRFLGGVRIRLSAHLADEDPDEPESTREAGDRRVDEELRESIALTAHDVRPFGLCMSFDKERH
jgi:hypothetical protein